MLSSQKKAPRSWRTRADPLAAVWESEIVPLLERAPGLKAVTILHELDFRVEANNTRRIRANLAEVPGVTAPGIRIARPGPGNGCLLRAGSLGGGMESNFSSTYQ